MEMKMKRVTFVAVVDLPIALVQEDRERVQRAIDNALSDEIAVSAHAYADVENADAYLDRALHSVAVFSTEDIIKGDHMINTNQNTVVCLHCKKVKTPGNPELLVSHGLHEECVDAYRAANGFPPRSKKS